MSKIAYIRVSTTHQNIQRQVEETFSGMEFDKVFSEKISGKDTNRPEFQKMMDYIREGDVVYFESYSRISRSLPDLLNIVETFENKKVSFVSMKEDTDTTTASGKLVFHLFASLAEYEREINKERREYGYNKAKDEGRVGRPSADETEEFKAAYSAWKSGKITATEAIKRSGMGRTTFYKLSKLHEQG